MHVSRKFHKQTFTEFFNVARMTHHAIQGKTCHLVTSIIKNVSNKRRLRAAEYSYADRKQKKQTKEDMTREPGIKDESDQCGSVGNYYLGKQKLAEQKSG